MLASYAIPNLAQGISQQPDAQRDPSQGEIQINGMSSILEGLRKRDCSQTIALVSNTDFGDAFIHSILRDNVEEYLAVITSTGIQVFDLDGTAQTVAAPTQKPRRPWTRPRLQQRHGRQRMKLCCGSRLPITAKRMKSISMAATFR